jgi:SNF2 family DNA or RNA helicase
VEKVEMSEGLSIKLWKDKAYLNGDFSEVRKVAMELPGFRKFVNDSLMFEPSGKNIEHLSKMEGISWSTDAKVLQKRYFDRVKREEELLRLKQQNLESGKMDFLFKTKPMQHQYKAISLCKDAEYYALFMEMGTGKTKVIIDNFVHLSCSNMIDGVVVIAPNGVHNQWVMEQIPAHIPDFMEYKAVVHKAGSKKSSREKKDMLDNPASLNIIAFNVESLSTKGGVEEIRNFLQKFRCMLVLDESTRIKTPSSLRTKNALKLCSLAPYRRIMSGAPITKGYEDLYTQLKFLHPDILGFSSFYTFRNYYCVMGGWEQKSIVGYRPAAIKELEQKMEAYSFRVTKKECLDLPEKLYTTRYVELTPEQEQIYKALEDDLVVTIEGQVLDTERAITQLLRMQQVVCGHIIIDEGKTVRDLPTNRLSALMDCIEEAQGKVIIWSRFVNDIRKIHNELTKSKIDHVLYYGAIGTTEREDNIKKFMTVPNCKVFLAQPASGGTGLNLAVADTVIYYSNDFNADTRWQSEDRAHRIGQKNKVTYVDLVSPKTIDVQIRKALSEKKNLADALLDDPRQFLSQRETS